MTFTAIQINDGNISITESYQGLRAVLSSRNREGHIIQVIQWHNAHTKSSENRQLIQFFNAAHSLHAQHGDQKKRCIVSFG
jgi:hypothetical protein